MAEKGAAGEITIGGQVWERTHIKTGQVITVQGPFVTTTRSPSPEIVNGSSLEDADIRMSTQTSRNHGHHPGHEVDVLATSAATRGQVGNELKALINTDYPALAVLSNTGIKDQVKSQENQIFAIFYAIMLVAVLVSLLGVVNTMLISVSNVPVRSGFCARSVQAAGGCGT